MFHDIFVSYLYTGKDKVIFVTQEDHEKPSNVLLEEEDDEPGIILTGVEYMCGAQVYCRCRVQVYRCRVPVYRCKVQVYRCRVQVYRCRVQVYWCRVPVYRYRVQVFTIGLVFTLICLMSMLWYYHVRHL